MKLKKLLKGIKVLNARQVKNVTIDNISNKTTDILTNGLYVCLKGENVDGHNLKQEAQRCGAVAFVVEEYDYDFSGLQILVEDTRAVLSKLARNFYGEIPKVIGITGTNGKTTTTNIVYHILKESGKKVGLIGTEGIFYNDQKITLHMTTPDPLELYKYLADMKNNDCEYAVMEVSAHAIFYKKVNAINFCIKALTNITEDHLDFFKTLSNYQKTKMGFMVKDKCIKIVNTDDKYGVSLACKNKNCFTYSINLPADARAENITCGGKRFNLILNGKNLSVESNLLGEYNVQNMLCGALICSRLGMTNSQILAAIKTFTPVDGRLNEYKIGNKNIVIDFAHTPDALKNVLVTLRKITQNKLYCLFGCGGNRETEKRSIMGQIAGEFSDFVYVTSDNPRFEEPDFIANQITSGIKSKNYKVILDRKTAIYDAINTMQDGDILAICGKGAENYLEIKGVKYPYSDKEVIEQCGGKKVGETMNSEEWWMMTDELLSNI